MNGSHYSVTATRNGVQLPAFLLSADVLGIVSEAHAERLARTILGGGEGLHVCAVRV